MENKEQLITTENTHGSTDKINECIQSINQVFNMHLKQSEAKMEKIMENKKMNNDGNNLDARIAQLETAVRASVGFGNKTEDTISRQLEDLGRFLRTGRVENKTIGTVDADGGLLLSRSVSQLLWRQICSFPLIDGVKKIDAKGKTVRVVSDTADVSEYAKWSKDGYNPASDTMTPALNVVEITTNTCCASTTVTRDFLDDMSEHDLQVWIQEALSQSFGEKISHAILFGSHDKSMEGIFTYFRAKPRDIKTCDINHMDVLPGLLEMMSSLDSRNIKNAAWYVSRDFFTLLMNCLLKSNTTQFVEMFKMSHESGRHNYTLLGKHIYVIPNMPDEYPVMLADMSSGYFLVQHENGNYKRSEAYDLDAIRYGYRIRVGGKVVDKNAFILGKINRRDDEVEADRKSVV